jgi:hypothetical protein
MMTVDEVALGQPPAEMLQHATAKLVHPTATIHIERSVVLNRDRDPISTQRAEKPESNQQRAVVAEVVDANHDRDAVEAAIEVYTLMAILVIEAEFTRMYGERDSRGIA